MPKYKIEQLLDEASAVKANAEQTRDRGYETTPQENEMLIRRAEDIQKKYETAKHEGGYDKKKLVELGETVSLIGGLTQKLTKNAIQQRRSLSEGKERKGSDSVERKRPPDLKSAAPRRERQSPPPLPGYEAKVGRKEEEDRPLPPLPPLSPRSQAKDKAKKMGGKKMFPDDAPKGGRPRH